MTRGETGARLLVTTCAAVIGCLTLGAAASGGQARPGGPRSASSLAPASLCRSTEDVILTCMVGPKILSLCGGNGQNASYRFGTAPAPEIALSSGNAVRFGVAQTGYSGGGEAQVQVTNGPTQYIVYSRIIRTGFGAGGNDPQAEAGVRIRQGGHTIATRRCTGATANASLDVTAAGRHMPDTAVHR